MTDITATAQRLLELSELPGVGVAALRRIVELSRASAHLPTVEEVTSRLVSSTRPRKDARGFAETVIARSIEEEIGIISVLDESYPPALRYIDDYPPLLYVRGSLSALSKISAAVVGTRESSKLGGSWARQIAEIFVENDFAVVSGLALGIDTFGHEGALRAGGVTIAILAHGLHQVTPASNRVLAERIVDAGGALVSEHPPGVPPRRAEYVRRNRIQSGMSMCSVVVESGDVGGAIHQGNFTRHQNRTLFCVVPERDISGAEEFRYGGAERLIREAGAEPLKSSSDLKTRINSGEMQERFEGFREKGVGGGLLV